MKKFKIIVLCFAAAGIFLIGGCITKGVKTVRYENGLVSVLKHDENSLAASVNVYIRTGAVDENPKQSGLSHFLEHLMFKGSENYPGDMMSRNVENLGGYINAGTGKEYTVYYINTQKDGIEEAVKMLADTMSSPLFPQDEIDKERKVVIEEIQRHYDNPISVLYETHFDNVYEKSALRNSIIGTENIIANVSREEIYNYYSTHYVPGKMVVVVAGNFDKQKISSLLKDTFGKFEKKPVPDDPQLIEELYKGKENIIYGKTETAYLISGFIGPEIASDDIFVADLAMTVLGGGKSSRLYRVLKEEKQLVYSIGSSFITSKGSGMASIFAHFNPENLNTIKSEIKDQIEDIINNGVSEEELKRAKLSMKTEWSFSFETSQDIASAYGYGILLGRPDLVDNYINAIQTLTSEDVQDFFSKYYSHDKFISTALLPETFKK